MDADDNVIEETLYTHRSVALYKIPARPDAGAHRSGDWLVSDKIFEGRLRAVGRGDAVELRLEEAGSGDLFAVCPYEFGKRTVAVEPVADSSRYYVLRVVDPTSGRHAFLGLGFDERGDAFDFAAALADHERHAQRERAAAGGSGGGVAGRAAAESEVAELHHHQDLSLKDGQTIRVDLKRGPQSGGRPGSASSSGGGGGGGGFMSRAAALPLGPLAPPPPPGSAPHVVAPPRQPSGGFEDAAAWSGGGGGSGGGGSVGRQPRKSGNPFSDDADEGSKEGAAGSTGGSS